MLNIHNALKRSLHALEQDTASCYITSFDRSGLWNCFPTFVYYCTDIPEAINHCTVKHGLIVFSLCYRCRGTPEVFEKMTSFNIRDSLRTTFILGAVHKLRTKINLLEILGELDKARLHKKTIEDNLKTTPWLVGCLSSRAPV